MTKIINRIQSEWAWIKINKNDILGWIGITVFMAVYIIGSGEWVM